MTFVLQSNRIKNTQHPHNLITRAEYQNVQIRRFD